MYIYIYTYIYIYRIYTYIYITIGTYYFFRWGHAVAQMVKALRHKSEGRGFDSRWCHWNFSLT